MTCSIFGEQIRLAPHIKNWWQALAVGLSNFVVEMFKCVMVGAAATGLVVLATEGGLAFLSNAIANFGATISWGGLGLRSMLGLNNMVQTAYVKGDDVNAETFTDGFWSMETGTANSMKNVATGQGTVEDYAGLLAWGAGGGVHEDKGGSMEGDVDPMMGDDNWKGKKQSGKSGYLDSPRMSRSELKAYKNGLAEKSINLEANPKLPSNKRAGFDPQNGKVYLRKGVTDFEAFHEQAHAEQWLT